jgi:hypothetical protein
LNGAANLVAPLWRANVAFVNAITADDEGGMMAWRALRRCYIPTKWTVANLL